MGRGLWGPKVLGTEPGGTWSPETLSQAKPRHTPPLAARRCSSFYNLPAERSDLRKICHKDVCRCAEGEVTGIRGLGLPGWRSRSPMTPPECRLG